MFDGTNLIYVYDGSFEGLLTAVFTAYSRRQSPDSIVTAENLQESFTQQVSFIETDETLSERVRTGILKKIGEAAYTKAWTSFLSNDPERGTKIYKYLVFGFANGRKILQSLAEDDVWAVEKMSKNVGWELNKMMGFVRFSQTEDGVYFSKINPTNNLLPMMMGHFANRFNTQAFVIYDENHNIAGVYEPKSRDWFLTETKNVKVPEYTEDEKMYRTLWKKFYDTIAIKERVNYNLRRQHMPKKYWKNITEM